MGKVKCLECGRIIESKYRHDFVECGCPNQTFIDGGDDYLRYGGVDMGKVVALGQDDKPLDNTEQEKIDKVHETKDVCWIQTYTGKAFFYNNPTLDDIDIVDIAHSLSLQCRFGGHSDYFYSIAQHSILASKNVHPKNALWGLLHDAAEAYIGDIPRPMKQLPQLKGIDEIEEKILRVVAQKFKLPWPMPEDIKRIDDELLYAEQEKLLGTPPLEYELPIKPKLKIEIAPLSALSAESEFLRQYLNLTGGCNCL